MVSEEVTVIAEAGVNHNGNLELAHKLVEAAANADADIVKFQTFHAADIVTTTAPKAGYQQGATGGGESQLEMLRKLELPPEAFVELKRHCEELGIGFLSTAFDLNSVEFLHNLGSKIWKVPSGEITNLPYLRKIGSYSERVILSTGMATLGEIETALDILDGAGTSSANVTLLHCTTEYPAPLASVNLRAMDTLKAAFPGIAGVGYSDHTQGIEVALAACARGAILVEKHFTLERSLPGPDHAASLEPAELEALVRGVRNIKLALGDGIKRPGTEELKNRIAARKSLVAATDIHKGEVFGPHNMTVKRPGSGTSPLLWDDYCGRRAGRDYRKDEFI